MRYLLAIKDTKDWHGYGIILLETNLVNIAVSCRNHLRMYYFPDELVIYDMEEHDFVEHGEVEND